MIELSTPVKNVSGTDSSHTQDEGLGEDDQLFFLSLKKDLNNMVKQPGLLTVNNLLNYSKGTSNNLWYFVIRIF